MSEHERFPIGSFGGVDFDLVAWGPAQATVDLSVACMFERELDPRGPQGGLLALDQALGGHLTRMRAIGAFRAQPLETLLVSTPPPGMAPRALLVTGMGDPAALDGELLRRAAHTALTEAVRSGAQSMAFAPSVLDAGHVAYAALDMQSVMLDGMLGALRAERMLIEAGLASVPSLRRCSFDVGAPRAQVAAQSFAAAFARLA